MQLHTEENPICATKVKATRLTLRPLALHTMYTTYVNDMQLKVILFPFALAKQAGRQCSAYLDELRWRTGLTVPSSFTKIFVKALHLNNYFLKKGIKKIFEYLQETVHSKGTL